MAGSLRFDTGEVELSYSEWPGESPPVVAFHGLSATRMTGLLQGRGGQHTYAYDARGHGESGQTPGGYTFVNFGRDAVAFLRGVVKEPAVLIGHSLGAMTAIYAAAHAPELVKGIFLGDPPLYRETGLRDERETFVQLLKMAGKPFDEVVAAGLPPERAETVSQLDPDVPAMVLDGSYHKGWDTDAYLRRIDCPVVLQHGDRSLGSALYEGDLERATAHIRKCTVLHLEGTGHVAWYTQAEAFFAAISRFIEEVS